MFLIHILQLLVLGQVAGDSNQLISILAGIFLLLLAFALSLYFLERKTSAIEDEFERALREQEERALAGELAEEEGVPAGEVAEEHEEATAGSAGRGEGGSTGRVGAPSENLLDFLVDGILTIDGGERILSYNRAAQTLFGYRLEEVLGKRIQSLITLKSKENEEEDEQRPLVQGNQLIGVQHEALARRASGEYFPVEVALSVVSQDPVQFAVTVRDITERKKREEALRLAAARGAGGEGWASGGVEVALLSLTAGEFRQPAKAIRDFVERLAQEQNLSAEARRCVRALQGYSRRMIDHMDDLELLRQLREGQVKADGESTEIAAFWRELAGESRSLIQPRGLELAWESPEFPEAYAYLTPAWWTRAFRMMFTFAMRHQQTGTLRLEAELKPREELYTAGWETAGLAGEEGDFLDQRWGLYFRVLFEDSTGRLHRQKDRLFQSFDLPGGDRSGVVALKGSNAPSTEDSTEPLPAVQTGGASSSGPVKLGKPRVLLPLARELVRALGGDLRAKFTADGPVILEGVLPLGFLIEEALGDLGGDWSEEPEVSDVSEEPIPTGEEGDAPAREADLIGATVWVASPDESVRREIGTAVEKRGGMVTRFESGAELIERYRQGGLVDVLVLDGGLPEYLDFDLAYEVRQLRPGENHLPVLLLAPDGSELPGEAEGSADRLLQRPWSESSLVESLGAILPVRG